MFGGSHFDSLRNLVCKTFLSYLLPTGVSSGRSEGCAPGGVVIGLIATPLCLSPSGMTIHHIGQDMKWHFKLH